MPTGSPIIAPCEGTCGRMTRPEKMSKHLAPDTVARVAGRCLSCRRTQRIEQGDLTVVDAERAEAAKEAKRQAGIEAAFIAEAQFRRAREARLAKTTRRVLA